MACIVIYCRSHLEEAATTCFSASLGVGFRDVDEYVGVYEGYAGEVRSELLSMVPSNPPWREYSSAQKCASHYYGALTHLNGCHSLQGTMKGLSGVAVNGYFRNATGMERF